MYKSFYNLKKKPFKISSDPAFMWLGEKHKEALATLKYGILDNKGFLLLTGDVGTGKTTLINALIESLSDDVICTSVPDPGLDKLDFFNYISAAFEMGQEFSTKGSFLAYFRKFLLQANADGKKVLLIIDESQLLTQEMLEEIRLLSNIEKTDTKLINIFFIGQNEFNEILNRQQNRAVRQRLTLNYNIDPLTPSETREYIKHRMSVAGCADEVFDQSATEEIFTYSGGFPRRINVLCDHCLLSGYVKEEKVISADTVKECARELKIPLHVRNRDLTEYSGVQESLMEENEPVTQNSSPRFHAQPRPNSLPPQEQLSKKREFKPVVFSFTLVVLLLLSWALFFPTHFSDSITRIKINIGLFQYQPIERQPDIVIPEVEKPDSAAASSITKPLQSSSSSDDLIKETKEPVEIETKKPDENVTTDNEPEAIEPVTSNIVSDPSMPAALSDSKERTLKKAVDPDTITIVPKLPEKKIVVRFKYNTSDFTEDGYNQLVNFSDILIHHPKTKILISGYTDSQGSQTYNRKLSEFRANIVKSFFMGRGIKAEQITIMGLGSQNPLQKNETAWGRMMNRRVEIEVVRKKPSA